MYINEVKRDNETLKKISEFQSSIENLVSVHEVMQHPGIIYDLPVSFIVDAENFIAGISILVLT